MLDDEGPLLELSAAAATHSAVTSGRAQLSCSTACANWVTEGGIDGFRFDLASVLGRDRHGKSWSSRRSSSGSPKTRCLRDTKLIAEPWDAAGLYQVGTFPGEGRWSDWNGRYRDDVRRFWRATRA